MNPNTKYEVPTLNQTYDMLLNQAQKIHTSHYQPDLIVAVARGGLVPARILSDLLETTDIAVIQVEFYVGIAKTRLQPNLKQALTIPIQGKKALIVDDISDTGKTLQLAKNHLTQHGASEVKIATLYTKPQSTAQPDFFEKETSRWVVFPWDAKETVHKIAAGSEGKRAVNREVAKLVKAGLPVQLAERFLSEVTGEP